jgi:hypothetical protein
MALVLNGSGITSANIADGTIVNADINSSAAIDGSKLTGAGKVLQVVNVQDGAVATSTTAMGAVDDTIPQNTEGSEIMTLAITPTSATSKLKIEVVVNSSHSVNSWGVMALFQDTTANALASSFIYQDVATGASIFTFNHYMTAGTTSATTFKVRAGSPAAGTFTFNGTGGGGRFGGTIASSITITEIKA